MTTQLPSLIWDCIVFVLFMLLSTIYPIWDEIKGKKGKNTKANYVFASTKLAMFPMMLSIARGTMSMRAFIGSPSELFYRGTGMWETVYGLLGAYPVVCFIFIPVYFNLGITSVYEYLDMRFNSSAIKQLCSATYVLRSTLVLGTMIYAPCIAMNTIFQIPYWTSLLFISIINIIFIILGGLKAAIIADTIQGVTFVLFCVLIVGQSVYEIGSVTDIYNINNENGRLKFFRFTGDLTTRVDTLSAFCGNFFIVVCQMGCQQNFIQRYLSMSSQKDITKTLMANVPLVIVLFSLSWIAGLVIYAIYYLCDPLKAGYIEKMDEILPFFVEDKLATIPGCLGIFLATLFNGSLCFCVSNIYASATVTWEDFLSQRPKFKNIEDKQQLFIIKCLGILYVIIVAVFGYLVKLLPNIFDTVMLVLSALTGPTLGVFLLAILVPMANGKGAVTGMVTSCITMLIMTIGGLIFKGPLTDLLPTSTEGCTNSTFSPWITKPESIEFFFVNSSIDLGEIDENFAIQNSLINFIRTIFSISYMYYSIIGTLITLIVGILVSWIFSSKSYNYNRNLLHPIAKKFMKKSPN